MRPRVALLRGGEREHHRERAREQDERGRPTCTGCRRLVGVGAVVPGVPVQHVGGDQGAEQQALGRRGRSTSRASRCGSPVGSSPDGPRRAPRRARSRRRPSLRLLRDAEGSIGPRRRSRSSGTSTTPIPDEPPGEEHAEADQRHPERRDERPVGGAGQVDAPRQRCASGRRVRGASSPRRPGPGTSLPVARLPRTCDARTRPAREPSAPRRSCGREAAKSSSIRAFGRPTDRRRRRASPSCG